MMNKPTVLNTGKWLLPVCVWGSRLRPDVPAEEKRPNVMVLAGGARDMGTEGRPGRHRGFLLGAYGR